MNQVPTKMPARYAAFLSYSRAADGRLAPALRDALQGFAKPWHRPRALRVFRDEAGLSANPALWPSIAKALDDSEYFILLASPEAATSPWVAAEADYWLHHKPSDRLLIAVTDGEIAWNAAEGDFDRATTTCLPAPLFGRLGHEPRWIDLRGTRHIAELSLREPHFREKVAELAAPLHGMAKDDLIGTDIRQHRRTRLLVRATIATLTVLTMIAGVATWIAIDRADAAEERRKFAEQQQSMAEENLRIAVGRQLTSQADAASVTQDHRAAAMMNVAAMHVHKDPHVESGLIRTIMGGPIGTTLLGHDSTVTSVAYAPNGQMLATASADKTIILWDLTAPVRPTRMGAPLTGHTALIYDVAFSPDGRLLASASSDGSVILWTLADPLSPVHGRPLTGHSGGVHSVTFAPDGRTLASGSLDGSVILWDLSNPIQPSPIGEPLVTPGSTVQSVAYSPDGRTLAAASFNGSVTLWDVQNRAASIQLLQLRVDTAGPVFSVTFAPNGRVLATTAQDGVILWDITDRAAPTRLGQPLDGHNDFVTAVAFSADGMTLASVANDNAAVLWDVADPAAATRRGARLTGHTDQVGAVAFAPDGTTLATGSVDGTAILWDLVDVGPAQLHTLTGQFAATFGSAGHLLATAHLVESVVLWDLSSPSAPRQYGRPIGDGDDVFSVALNRDGKVLAVGGTERLALWDVSDPARPRKLGSAESDSRYAISFSPDGTTLATAGSDDGATLWDVSEPARLRKLSQPSAGTEQAFSVAFAPDGHTLAVGSSNVLLWDVTDPRQPVVFGEPLAGGHRGVVRAMAFSPNGYALATGGYDQRVFLWDVTDPAQPSRLGQALEEDGEVRSVAFSPDGRMLATAAGFSVHLRDITDPVVPMQLLSKRLGGHSAVVSGVEFSPDQPTFVTVGVDGKAILWDYTPLRNRRDNAVTLACLFAGRGLNADEWKANLPGIDYHDTCADALQP